MANVNITEVHLLSVPLENDYLHTLYFASREAQTNYFLSRKVAGKSYFDFTYQRKDNSVRIPAHYDSLIGCNYVMYKNVAYTNRWFYGFITSMNYISDGLTEVFIETDVIQSWMFNPDGTEGYVVKPSFVEREHTDNDEVGANTVPEGLETGDYVCNDSISNKGLSTKGFVIASTVDLNIPTNEDDPKNVFPNVAGDVYGGIYSGVTYFYSANVEDINEVLLQLAKEGKTDAITSIFCIPPLMFTTYKEKASDKFAKIQAGMTMTYKTWTSTGSLNEREILKPTSLNGYPPKNNKLLAYPYQYLLMSNNSGGAGIYHYEKFKDTTKENLCNFSIASCITPGCSIRLTPLHYNGVTDNNEEGLNCGKYPICNWNTDVYTNWLTQNGTNIGISLVSGTLQMIGGVALGMTGAGALAGAGGVTSGALSIASTLGEVSAKSMQPPQAEGNLNSGDVTYSANMLTFTAYQMSIKEEYARILDGYFSMFGYKVNRLKVPNKNHRENYWYTKTIDVNIDGAIPNDDIQKIKEVYNKGITFWRNSSNIGDYTASNNII